MSIQPVVSGSGSGAAAGAKMDLVDAPNATAVTALNAALAALLGTPANTGGTATLAAILGNPSNSSLVARLTALASGIGTPANAGGTATLAAILGDPANSSLVARLALLYTDSQKIAAANAGGMAATADSLAYHAHVARRALNHYERWYSKAAAPNAEIHVADNIGNPGTAAFQIDGGGTGTGSWGSWVQILGSSDTPIVGEATYTKYNLHKIFIVATEEDSSVYFVQFGFGTSGAAALAAGTYSELVFKASANNTEETVYMVRARRVAAGTKAWARCWCVGKDTGTFDFYLSVIQYEG